MHKREASGQKTQSKRTLYRWRSQTYVRVYLSHIINVRQGAGATALVSRGSACRRSWNFVIRFPLLLQPKTQVQTDLVEHTKAQKQQVNNTKQDVRVLWSLKNWWLCFIFVWLTTRLGGCVHIQNSSQNFPYSHFLVLWWWWPAPSAGTHNSGVDHCSHCMGTWAYYLKQKTNNC